MIQAMAASKAQPDYSQAPEKSKGRGGARSPETRPIVSLGPAWVVETPFLAHGVLVGCAWPRLDTLAGGPHPEITLAEAGIRLTIRRREATGRISSGAGID